MTCMVLERETLRDEQRGLGTYLSLFFQVGDFLSANDLDGFYSLAQIPETRRGPLLGEMCQLGLLERTDRCVKSKRGASAGGTRAVYRLVGRVS